MANRGDAGPSSGVGATRDSSATAPDPVGPPAFEQTSAEDGGPSTWMIILGGVGLIAVVFVGGFLLYRRRLPT